MARISGYVQFTLRLLRPEPLCVASARIEEA
jgi:hypothetical protein